MPWNRPGALALAGRSTSNTKRRVNITNFEVRRLPVPDSTMGQIERCALDVFFASDRSRKKSIAIHALWSGGCANSNAPVAVLKFFRRDHVNVIGFDDHSRRCLHDQQRSRFLIRSRLILTFAIFRIQMRDKTKRTPSRSRQENRAKSC